MHISEGVLSLPVLATGGTITFFSTMYGLKKLDYDKIMTVAMFSSAFFVASFIHIPLGPGSVHLLLSGIVGLILGWAAFPAILAALFLQALLFQYGGLAVIGVNTVIIAAPAVILGLFFRPWLVQPGKKRFIASGAAGFFSIFFSSLLMAAALIATDAGFAKAALLLVAWSIPVSILEGVITISIVKFLATVQPEILFFSENSK
ncbi:MAG: cobalt transporter CbiM [Desulfobulbaceae bacterium]|nr:MAG: cobalt transporter CbiM [Desulfobulbaceae bacterium]